MGKDISIEFTIYTENLLRVEDTVEKCGCEVTGEVASTKKFSNRRITVCTVTGSKQAIDKAFLALKNWGYIV